MNSVLTGVMADIKTLQAESSTALLTGHERLFAESLNPRLQKVLQKLEGLPCSRGGTHEKN